MKKEGRVLLDIRGLLIRAYNMGTDPDALLGADGKSYNRAEYGLQAFLDGTLGPILQSVPPRLIIACWDGGSRYREVRFSGYKARRRARRQEQDKVEVEQYEKLFNLASELFKAIGAIQARVPGTEADDLIAALTGKLAGPTMVYTVDGDLAQLSNEACTVVVGDEVVGDEYKGVSVGLIRLYKSIVGDSSDEYPGVKGLGQKAWEGLQTRYGLDGLHELDDIVRYDDRAGLEDAVSGAPEDKALAKILERYDEWRLSYDLATLHPFECDRGLPSGKRLQKIAWTKRLPDTDRALAVLDEADCNEYVELVREFLPTQTLITADNLGDYSSWLSHIGQGGAVAFDYETYDALQHAPFQEVSKGRYVEVLGARLTGASFCAGDNYQHTIYISVEHKDTANCELSLIADALEKSQKVHDRLVVQNAMFELPVTRTHFGAELLKAPADTKIMASYVDENEPSGLKQSALHYLRYQQTSYAEVTRGRAMNELTGTEVLGYGADDAFVTAHLFDLYSVIMQVEGSWAFFLAYEIDSVEPILERFEHGVEIDFERLGEMRDADAKVHEQGMERLRELLAEHCPTEEPERAQGLIDAELENIKTLAEAKGKGRDYNREQAERFRKACIAATQYRPLVTSRKTVEFKPTKKQINELAKKLGFEAEITSTAASKVSDWLVSVSDDVDALGSRARKFCDLIADAADQLNKREGEEYEAFFAFCQQLKDEDAPVETHGDELNFDSPPQMQQLFYCKLGLPVRTRSKVDKGSARDKVDIPGSPSANEEAVQMALAEDVGPDDWRHEFLTTFLKVKEALTRRKFYWTPYPLWQRPDTGRIHPQITNCGTVTRRPTGSSPNMLQVEKGPVRSMYLADADDHVVVSIDFNGQELRIMGSEANDPVLIDAYCGEVIKDVHSVTGAGIAPKVFRFQAPGLIERYVHSVAGKPQVPYEEFVRIAKGDDEPDHNAFDKVRKAAKAVNFLISYLGTSYTLAKRLMVPGEVAQEFIDGFFLTYPRVGPWQEEVIEFAHEHGYTQTAYGNRRHLNTNIYAKDKQVRRRLERQAVNYIIQGTAADILKIVLFEITRRRVQARLGARLIAPVYDEVVASVPVAATLEYVREMSEIMTITPPGHAIPMLPEVSIGNTWHPQIELGAHPSDDAVNEALERLAHARKEAA